MQSPILQVLNGDQYHGDIVCLYASSCGQKDKEKEKENTKGTKSKSNVILTLGDQSLNTLH